MGAVDLSIVVVNYNTAHLLGRMFATIDAASHGLNVDVIVVDNASRDDSVARLKTEHSQAMLIESPSNIGFGRANNLAIPHLRGDFVLLLNTDAFVREDSFQLTLAQMRRDPTIGILGVRLIGEDGLDQPSCRHFPTPLNLFLHRVGLSRYFPGVRPVDDPALDRQQSQPCDWVPGCYLLLRREVVATCGLFDPRYFLYSEEVDLCRRVQSAGWKIFYCAETRVIHLGGESAKSEGKLTDSGKQLSPLMLESLMLYLRKHHGAAGLMSHVVLSVVADVIIALKAVVKCLLGRGSIQAVLKPWRDQLAQTRALVETRAGMVATR